jgi:hypothetical protein
MGSVAGIYCIYWEEADNLYYIGCSNDIEHRVYKQHLYMLKTDRHTNYKLQDAYNTYGTPKVHILEKCTPELLYKKEIEWIKEFNSYYAGLNLTGGGNGTGFGSNHPDALYSESVYKDILFELVYSSMTHRNISKKLNVSIEVVQSISTLKAHKHLKSVYPEQYMLLERKNTSIKVSRSHGTILEGRTYPLIISPSGEVFNVTNVAEFSRDHNIQVSALSKLLLFKTRKTLSGWTRKELE